jgi:hypothetical protein
VAHLRKSGITVDFQRILGFASYLPCFKDFVLDPSGFEEGFEEGSAIGRNKGVSTQIYLRWIGGAMTVVKTNSLSRSIERRQLETEIENLWNLRHPMIAPLTGCVLPVESSGQREFRTVRLYTTEGSLADVLSNPPAWWTPTAKANVIVSLTDAFPETRAGVSQLPPLSSALGATNEFSETLSLISQPFLQSITVESTGV